MRRLINSLLGIKSPQDSFSCKVAHIALTPLAGSPIRIVQGLNKYTSVRARLITINDYKDGRSFPNDLRWWVKSEHDEALSHIESADVIHLHHWLDLENHKLEIDFLGLLRRGKKIIRQFHSNPEVIATHNGTTVERIVTDSLPQLTIPQFHERMYPRARLVPQIILFEDPPYSEPHLINKKMSVYYRPSTYEGAFAKRWDTKGAPEVSAALRWVETNVPGIRIDCELKPLCYEENLRRRMQCAIAIDDVVTGSYHLTSLESMALGLANISYLDARQVATLVHFTGSADLPFLNCRLEELPELLKTLAATPELVRALGDRSRQWMERYWHPRDMAAHYRNAYRDLLESGMETFSRPRFNDSDIADRWLVRGSSDFSWDLRRHAFEDLAAASK